MTRIPQSPQVAQETFTCHKAISIPTELFSWKTKYGNGCCRGFPPRFLIPEHIFKYVRQRIQNSNALRLFFCY